MIGLHLRSVEEEMAEIERLIRSEGEEGVLYRVRNSLREVERRELLEKIKQVRQGLFDLKELFDFPTEERDVVPTIRALLSHGWVVLCETESKQLKGFGNPEPELAAALDPWIEKLIELVQEIQAQLQLMD
ncbi:hypothetical protein HYR54_17445 [Candidatus Acetothermia bacterium]|nr:hypothetical protein [Candidatus Acetothermia bacterium]